MTTTCCSGFGDAADQHFTRQKAERDLARLRRKGPDETTRLLRDGLVKAGLPEGTLLDVGAGIGTLTFELLDRGMSRAVLVEASTAYLTAAAAEASRRGRSAATEFRRGDFLELASELQAAAVVTLDRVVCCYPQWRPLLEQALAHAARAVAYSYPRDCWYVKAGVALENAGRRVKCKPFRTFVHSAAQMEEAVCRGGFELVSRRHTWMWTADVYIRSGQPA